MNETVVIVTPTNNTVIEVVEEVAPPKTQWGVYGLMAVTVVGVGVYSVVDRMDNAY